MSGKSQNTVKQEQIKVRMILQIKKISFLVMKTNQVTQIMKTNDLLLKRAITQLENDFSTYPELLSLLHLSFRDIIETNRCQKAGHQNAHLIFSCTPIKTQALCEEFQIPQKKLNQHFNHIQVILQNHQHTIKQKQNKLKKKWKEIKKSAQNTNSIQTIENITNQLFSLRKDTETISELLFYVQNKKNYK